MKCPKCGSEDCQRLEVVFEGGTQNINTTSRTSGAGITGGASMGGALAHTKTTGTSQSTLAQKASPPQKQKLGVFIVMIIVGFFMLSAVSIVWKILGVLLMIGAGYLIFKVVTYNINEYPKKYQYWLNEWLCHKCGTIYHQEF